MTYLDWTAYYQTLPADAVDIAFNLESDRMVNSIFDPEETERERTVIISEREGNENEPMFLLTEAVRKAAFEHHPYGRQVIGEMDDLRVISRDDLYNHYRRYYSPANAVIAIAGDFDTNEVLRALSDKYQSIPTQVIDDAIIEPEDKISKEKEVIVEGPGDAAYFQLSYRAPRARNADFFALMVLDSFLTGPTSLSLFGGGGISNKTSRLYQTLVEKDLSMSISGGLQSTIDPFLYNILVILSPQQSSKKIIQVIDAEITRLQQEPLPESEIARAIKQAKALFAYGSESITNQAFWMGYASMFADYSWFDAFILNLEQVTAENVMCAARTYLNGNQRVTGLYLPNNAKGGEGGH